MNHLINRQNYIKVGLLFFVFLLVLVEGIQMVFGYRLKTGKEHDPFTWSEILEFLPSDIFMISILCIILIVFLKQSDKFQDEKEKEYAQKRKDMNLNKTIDRSKLTHNPNKSEGTKEQAPNTTEKKRITF
ncbi:MAG: hypothetical protein GX273_00625 [Bacteroidales bacterium]|nr:hypothetical protein [Bacteroidales bacterium]